MTLPHRGRGRRDNGLQAPLWAPLRDVDPRVGEHLLDLLREAGIAAYLEPSTDVSPYTRTVHLPSPPADRLYVDRARRVEARTVVDGHGDSGPTRPAGPAAAPSRRPIAEDAAFAQLVAAFEADHGPVRIEPDADQPPAPEPEPRPASLPAVAAESSVLDAPEEHYEPPPAPPVPMLAPFRLYALLLIIIGAVLIIAPGRLGLSLDLGLVLGVAGVASGVALLVSRMKERSVEDGDDGAVV